MTRLVDFVTRRRTGWGHWGGTRGQWWCLHLGGGEEGDGRDNEGTEGSSVSDLCQDLCLGLETEDGGGSALFLLRGKARYSLQTQNEFLLRVGSTGWLVSELGRQGRTLVGHGEGERKSLSTSPVCCNERKHLCTESTVTWATRQNLPL